MNADDSASEAPIDRSHLARLCLGDSALELELLDLFYDRSAELLDALLGAMDSAERCDHAHALKGAALAIGARQVATAASFYEALVRQAAEPSAVAGAEVALAEAVALARRAAATANDRG